MVGGVWRDLHLLGKRMWGDDGRCVFAGWRRGALRMARCLVMRTAGTNCEVELCRAFEMAGARVELVHLDRVLARGGVLDGYELIAFPGGFSYGDDIAAGRVLAVRVRERLWGGLRDAVERGACVIGVCNGFQVLTQVGLLPGPSEDESGEVSLSDVAPMPTVALAENTGGRFVDRWVRMELGAGWERCVWTRGLEGLAGDEQAMMLPIAHGEGRFVGARDVVEGLVSSGQAVLRYAAGDDPNGSMARIAGISDATGRVFGLMPHPERYLSWGHHPWGTRLGVRRGDTPGLAMFRGAVEAVREGVTV